jgi:hypothetical protein
LVNFSDENSLCEPESRAKRLMTAANSADYAAMAALKLDSTTFRNLEFVPMASRFLP